MRVFSRFAILSVAACGGLPLTYTDPPVELPREDARFADGVRYDDKDRTLLDLVHFPTASAPTALAVFIHGGGFQGGERQELYTSRVEDLIELVDAGVAVASIEYTLLDPDIDEEGVIKCLSDSRRAVQFLRHHADSLNLDPDRVGVFGVSAGAGTSLWLATHDDMADPDAADPILAQSTRVSAAAVYETQATYDMVRWTDDVFETFNLDLFQTAESFGLSQRLLNFYGIQDLDDLFSPAIEAYRAEVDMLGLMTSDDPPFWVRNDVERETFPLSVSALFHHPLHASTLIEAAQVAGVTFVADVPRLGIEPDPEETAAAFLIRHLNP
jgi:para-nitrobenzyl esterase